MYTAFYGLREKPFALSPDPRFLFLAESHREALAHLLYGIEQGEGFIAITGEVGTGKTTLCRTLLRRLGAEVEVAFLFNPQLSARELIEAIHAELGIESLGGTLRELMDELNQFLLAKQREGRRVLLIVDEAQGLQPQTLEQIRLLSNLETESRKLIQILLLGQPELDVMLASPGLRQLRQRIAVRWRLDPLGPAETRAYIRHRLHIAAGGDRELFTEAALRQIHRTTRGIPRLVNVLCDRALLSGFASRSGIVGRGAVRRAARELAAGSARRPGLRRLAWGTGLAAAAALAFVGLEAVGPSGPDSVSLSSDTGLILTGSTPPGSWEVGLPQAPLASLDALPRASAPSEDAASTTSAEGEASLGHPVVEDLARRLALHPPGATAASALRAILEAWNLPAPAQPETPVLSFAALLGELNARQLAVLALPRTELAMVRALDHPTLLEVTAADGAARVLALRALDVDRALVAGVELDSLAWVPIEQLERRWGGDAYLVWQDFENLPEVLRVGDAGEPVAWLQFSLRELGFYADTLSARFDRPTREAVRAFQQERRLESDGAVGPLTKMALYEALTRYPVPGLSLSEDMG